MLIRFGVLIILLCDRITQLPIHIITFPAEPLNHLSRKTEDGSLKDDLLNR